MTPVVRMEMREDTLLLHTRVYIELHVENREVAKRLICDGIERISRQSPYRADGRDIRVLSQYELAPAFSAASVNVRVIDKPVTRRMGIARIFNNVSRAYPDARRTGLFKLIRRVLRFPDVIINLGGKDIDDPADYGLMCSVVAHEFAHVWGCGDQYKLLNDEKRKPDVAQDDLMYRTGVFQRMQGYHIAKLCAYAKKGKLPLRKIV